MSTTNKTQYTQVEYDEIQAYIQHCLYNDIGVGVGCVFIDGDETRPYVKTKMLFKDKPRLYVIRKMHKSIEGIQFILTWNHSIPHETGHHFHLAELPPWWYNKTIKQ